MSDDDKHHARIADRKKSDGDARGNAVCKSCGSYDLRVANVLGGCCASDEFTEVWQAIGCLDCGQDNGLAFNAAGMRLLATSRPLTLPDGRPLTEKMIGDAIDDAYASLSMYPQRVPRHILQRLLFAALTK